MTVCVYNSLCDFVGLVLLLPFVLRFYLFGFSFFLYFRAVCLARSWCSSQVLGLRLHDGRAESRRLDHQRPPGPM